jgi:predicted Zn-dependent peptidase
MKLASVAALAALLVVAFVSRSASAGPCVRKDLKTVMVKAACEKGGQDAAKTAMKAFNKDHKIKSCNQCHTKLAPSYELKADAVQQFAKLGGELLGAAPKAPAKADPPKVDPPKVEPAKVKQPDPPAGGAPVSIRPAIPSNDPKINFEKYTLPNGLEVILAPDKNVPIVSVNVWYHVGSGHEVYGRSGFAHLFEHMMFQGSKHVGEDRHFSILKKIGESGVNGTTNLDRTNYFETVPSNQLETALWLESDRMGYLLQPPMGKDGKPVVFKESLANQIEVVRNERRQRYDNAPYGKALFAQFAGLYPERHPYRYLTIGKHEDLEKASVDDVQSFFKTWYVPANATLAIVGDFDVAATKKLVEKWFAGFPKSSKPTPVSVPAPAIRASETVVSDEFAKLRQIRFSWHSPANFAEGDAELDIAADALTREGPGRLYKALVYDRPFAQSVQASQSGSSFSGIFTVNVTLRSEAKLDEVKQIVASEIARITKTPLDAKELARVVTSNEAFGIRGLETLMGRAEALQRYNHYLGDPNKITWDLDRYRNTTPEKVRATAAKYLVPDRMVTTITNPAASSGGKK